MSKFNLKIKEEKEVKGIKTLAVEREEKLTACKECKADPRARGSSRCEDCTTSYKIKTHNSNRLSRKIDEQGGVINNVN